MKDSSQTGLIAYFAKNPVAANLMMLFIVVIGSLSYIGIQRQMFPNIEVNYVTVRAYLPGASVTEIEESIVIKVEEAIKNLNGIKKVVSEANRGKASIAIEIDKNQDLNAMYDRIKEEVDAISSFPTDMETLIVTMAEFKQDVLQLLVVSPKPLFEIVDLTRDIGDEIRRLPHVTDVSVWSPTPEISVEVTPLMLRKYGLTLSQISRAIQNYSANISAGQVKTRRGVLSVRIEGQSTDASSLGMIPVIIGEGGASVLLKDIATIKDGFTERERYTKFSGDNAISISVHASTSDNMIDIANSVNEYIGRKNRELPPDFRIETIVDMTYYLNARLDMMLTNLLQGAALVALLLGIFLRVKLAFWVIMGLPVSFLGAVMLMPLFDVSINVVTLFSFIMVLGIVVDDAIVIGESASAEIEKNGSGVNNVIRGARRVATPATFGVLTTIAVFTPFLFSTGSNSTFFFGIATVAILCLAFSLIESKLILPAHLAHIKFSPIKSGGWRDRFNKRFFRFVNGPFRSLLTSCIRWRWSVLSVFIGLLLLTVALIIGNFVRSTLVPKVPHDYPIIEITMSNTVSSEQTVEATKKVVGVVKEVDRQIEEETGLKSIQSIFAFNKGVNEATIVTELADESVRPLNAFELARRWREAMPPIAGVKSLVIVDTVNAGGRVGDDFGFLLFGDDINDLKHAGRLLMSQLSNREGLFDISSTADFNSLEIRLELLPVAYDLGLNLQNVGQQVSEGFYGGEAQRLNRDGEDIRVMVRYPRETRDSVASLNYAVITTPDGEQVMLGDVARISLVPSVSEIRRENRLRGIYVFGSIDEATVEPKAAVDAIKRDVLPTLQQRFPGITLELSGAIKDQQDEQNEQLVFFVAAMIMVYILLAVPLSSYWQPLIIMSVIPFSFIGAIFAHYFLDVAVSMTSSFGLVAAAGVVINDSLVMTDFINQIRKKGVSIRQAVVEAGCQRFRAITLTSVTTFAGVLPIMFETSLQARFVIPMAVSLAFAVLFATLVTLILVPCLYLILDDISSIFRFSTSEKVNAVEDNSLHE
ncbi:efflux RND transporter permease subunit [Veronia pacifica]|uniref:Acriflavin resistance protein n=1 Tax=Veronia pacifica TaxID=1080227 RepID=A0A1C3EQT4_9GAMM|nr:efflux RND transporter permease subunit [Veronia pacifica]ODA35601.1 acriflavin resistance protein [Veronia pacifica]